MLVREVITDAKTGEVTERWIEVPDVMTVEQGQAVMAVEAAHQANKLTLEDRAVLALAANKTYIGRASPTAAQNTAQIKALSQQSSAIIRLLLGKLEATD